MKEQDKSRRDFLKTLGIAGAGALVSCNALKEEAGASEKEESKKAEKVSMRTYGKTGEKVSSLALGGMFDVPNNQLLLKKALEWGVSYWDTADCYGGGRSEKGIGKFFRRNPDERKKVFLVTKSDRRDPEGLTYLLNRSLKRMKTDHVDLYLVHGISSIRELNKETKAWAEKAKKQGKIRFFGFSTHKNMESCLSAAAGLGWIDGIMMTYNYRLMHSDKMKRAVDYCLDAGIGLTAMKTQGGGSVSITSESELKLAGRFVKQGFTDKQSKLIAVWQNEQISSICSQMPNLTILMSNIGAALRRPKLSSADKKLFERYAQETCNGYCAGCASICESKLASHVPVSDIMRYMMYHNSYSDDDRGKILFNELSQEVRREMLTADYSKAERACPQNMPIAEIMHKAGQILV